MILYFSGTGNSRYIAQVIESVTKDQLVSMNDLIKKGFREDISSDRPLIFVCPTYAWRIPRVVESFIRKTHFSGNTAAYFIMNCGSETGNAVNYIKKLCLDKQFEFKGISSVVMPENYIAMYDVPDSEQAEAIIQKALPQILHVADLINSSKPLPEENKVSGGRVMSSIINPIFYRIIVKAKGFHLNDTCTGCGKCMRLCPLNNINIVDGKPVWSNNCTHCMACICGCPSEAIEYKKKSKGQPRYNNKGYR